MTDSISPSRSDEEIVRRAYEAFARGDIDAAVADLYPQVEWIEPDEFPMGGRHVNRAAVHDYLSASRAGWRQLSTTVTLHRVNGKVIAEHHLTGVLLDGSLREALVADVFTVRNQQVVHVQAYANPADAFAAESKEGPISPLDGRHMGQARRQLRGW
jgi:ketosteroid isomerase-like protein